MKVTEVWVCTREALVPGAIRTARLGEDRTGLPIVAILLRAASGQVVAYRNLCRHLPVPLDGGTGELASDDGAHLVCGTHGATYRITDGYCVEGPCEGLSLERLVVREAAEGYYVAYRPA